MPRILPPVPPHFCCVFHLSRALETWDTQQKCGGTGGRMRGMRVHLGCDHAGYELVQHLVGHLSAAGHDVSDHGPTAYDEQDDYPPYCIRAAQAVVDDPGSLG